MKLYYALLALLVGVLVYIMVYPSYEAIKEARRRPRQIQIEIIKDGETWYSSCWYLGGSGMKYTSTSINSLKEARDNCIQVLKPYREVITEGQN